VNALQSHTPGPWRTTGMIVFAQRNPGGRKTYIADASQDAGLQPSMANAKLIAAAPDLLKALEQCEHVIGMARLQGKLSDDACSEALIAARKALDKLR